MLSLRNGRREDKSFKCEIRKVYTQEGIELGLEERGSWTGWFEGDSPGKELLITARVERSQLVPGM